MAYEPWKRRPKPADTTLTRVVMGGIWLAAILLLSGPIVMFTQNVIYVVTGRWLDWRLWGLPLGPLLFGITLIAGTTIALSFKQLDRFTQRRHNDRRAKGQTRI